MCGCSKYTSQTVESGDQKFTKMVFAVKWACVSRLVLNRLNCSLRKTRCSLAEASAAVTPSMTRGRCCCQSQRVYGLVSLHGKVGLVTEELSVQPKVAKDLMHLRGSREDTIASAHQDPLMCALKMPRKIPVNPLLDLKEQISYRPRRTLAILRPNNAGPQGAVSESQRIENCCSDQ